MASGLFIMRRIEPSRDFAALLDRAGQLYEMEDGARYVKDDVPRDSEINEEIAGGIGTHGEIKGCTVGWAIFDEDWNVIGTYARLDKAERALAGAKVQVKMEVELEEVEDDEPVDFLGVADGHTGGQPAIRPAAQAY